MDGVSLKGSRALGIEKPAAAEPSEQRFLAWVVQHLVHDQVVSL